MTVSKDWLQLRKTPVSLTVSLSIKRIPRERILRSHYTSFTEPVSKGLQTLINYPRMGLTVDSLQLTFLPSSKSRDTKTRTNMKNPAWTNQCSVASSHCKWWSRVFENGRTSNFEGLVTLTLDRVILHYRRASLIDLYLHAKFHWNRINVLRTGGRTDSRTDIWDRLY